MKLATGAFDILARHVTVGWGIWNQGLGIKEESNRKIFISDAATLAEGITSNRTDKRPWQIKITRRTRRNDGARVVHRIGVALFVFLLCAALGGLVGKGPLSKSRAGNPQTGLQVEHFRFIRYQGPVELKIRLGAQATASGRVQLQLSKAFVEQVEIERIEPEPDEATAGPKYFTYDIRTETNAVSDITVRFVSNHLGRLGYEVGLAENPKVKLHHFAFP